METATKRISKDIPVDHVKVLFWKRGLGDEPFGDTAGTLGNAIIPANRCLSRAREADSYSDSEWGNAPGHGLTIVWPSGRSMHVAARP